MKNRNYDLRISIIPVIFGENIVIRIFDRTNDNFTFESIGLDEFQSELLDLVISAMNGLVLLCGPTGCGKTTTLYTILKKISSSAKKIITIEDPIEYRLDGVNQVAVNDDIGLTFASILRSILRQSPNIIMIGEIRDVETAELAVQAALTGHLVFSTIHCHDALSAITRLSDLKISKFLINSCLRGVVAQKLVRKSCQFCQKETPNVHCTKNFPIKFGQQILSNSGCESCYNRGYSGRTAIFDFAVNENIYDSVAVAKSTKIEKVDGFCHVSTFEKNIYRLLEGRVINSDEARQALLACS